MVKVGDTIKFGKYDWRALDVLDGKTLIITEDIVVRQLPYHSVAVNKLITWEKSDLRGYLNNEFYNSFGDEDRQRIALTENVNKRVNGEKNVTSDYVFPLSIDEAYTLLDKFYKIAARGDTASWWWLRCPCYFGHGAIYAYFDGHGNVFSCPVNLKDIGANLRDNCPVNLEDGGVRPALWLNP
ncbi:MAG: DUF6273 domain-containing protein [Clostridiales bacterium]|jgi:hypothetical protein|nr:DUF6273 domain-containing protein [Clostridiales bacterium]